MRYIYSVLLLKILGEIYQPFWYLADNYLLTPCKDIHIAHMERSYFYAVITLT